MTDHGTVLAATLGAATTLAGLLLVFQGFLSSSLSQYGAGDDPRLKLPFKVGLIAMAIGTVLALAVALLSILAMEGADVFDWAVRGLVVAIAFTILASLGVSWTVVKG